jgi:hypothetical protein
MGGTPMTNSYPRETVEFLPITVTLNAATITTGVTFCDVPDGARPVTFTQPTTLSGRIGVMVQGYQPGPRRVWAQVASDPEDVVIDCGTYQIT